MNINIVSAHYGVSGHLADVTEIIRSMLQHSNGNVPINNQSMGSDPAVGQQKHLSVVYFCGDGPPRAMVGTEGSTIHLAAESVPHDGLRQGLM